MHKLLVRQIKRELGVDEAQLAAVCDELKQLAGTSALSPEAAFLIGGLNGLLGRVDAAYEQSDRDLKLKIRSLELSSQELSQVNARLRDELSGRVRAIQSLRDTANTLMHTMNDRLPPLADDNLESLSALTAELVRQREKGQLELQKALADLANQKFALDQHAIVTMTDAQGVITYANDKFCEISGYAREELLGQNHRMLKSNVHPPEFFTAMWATISGGQVWHGEISNQAKDGRIYWLNATIVPFCDVQGAPVQYIAIRTDITDRKLQGLMIQATEERLRRITNAVPVVVYQWEAVGGQLRYNFLSERLLEVRGLTPEALRADPGLATAQIVEEDRERVMQGIFSAAERRVPWHDEYRIVKPDGSVRWLRGEMNPESELAADGASESLLTIINDILDFSKIEAGKLQVEQISFNLWQTLNDALKALALDAHSKGLELVSAIAPEVPCRLLGDPGRLRQIIVNLAGNAIKFTARGEVVLRVDREPDYDGKICLHFWISDSGIGISPEKLASIFEAFAQEDSSITREYGGTGLGLTISSRLVEIFGGKLRVESLSGQGSTFHFTSLFAPDASCSEPAPDTVSLAARRLLLVDDHQINRQVMAQELCEAGAEVVEAASGEAALEALARLENGAGQGFDLIVLDAGMPGLDGLATAERMRERPSVAATPLVLLTSGNVKGGVQRLHALGFAACLPKPVARDELCLTLRRVLDGQSLDIPMELAGQPALRVEQLPLDILLVEDHLINQKLIVLLLERWGHRVTLAENGLQAIEFLRLRYFDIVLMDMMMPVMDGLEATRRIRTDEQARNGGRTPIIAMTANAMRGDRETCLQAGMDGYIAKPIKSGELQALLQQYARGGVVVSVVSAPDADESADIDSVDEAFDYAQALRQADQEMVEISVGIFLKHFPRDLEIIRGGLAANDAQAVRFVVHALRGNLAMFGGRPAAALAYRLEKMAVLGELAGAEDVLALLEREVEKLMSVLTAFAATQEAG